MIFGGFDAYNVESMTDLHGIVCLFEKEKNALPRSVRRRLIFFGFKTQNRFVDRFF